MWHHKISKKKKYNKNKNKKINNKKEKEHEMKRTKTINKQQHKKKETLKTKRKTLQTCVFRNISKKILHIYAFLETWATQPSKYMLFCTCVTPHPYSEHQTIKKKQKQMEN